MDLQQFLSWTLNEHSAMLYIDQILMLSAHLYIVDTTSFVLNISWILMHSRLSLSHIFSLSHRPFYFEFEYADWKDMFMQSQKEWLYSLPQLQFYWW